MRIAALVIVLLLVAPAEAFDIATHAHLADRAYVRSVLVTDPTLIERLGLVDAPADMSEGYWDFSDSQVFKRRPTRYEVASMPRNRRVFDSHRIVGWIMRGAIREDDKGPNLNSKEIRGGRDRDPFEDFNRFCNHFYDPLKNRGMVAAGPAWLVCPDNERSVSWAVGAVDPFVGTTQRLVDARNHFSLYAAREAQWRALTLQDRNGQSLGGADPDITRMAYWATAFKSLGHVIHLIQDLGQPQHTRNDAHGAGEADLLEVYTEARARELRVDTIVVANRGKVSRLARPFDSVLALDYPVPAFPSYSLYWTTGLNQTGLANYTNRGFLTYGTWLNDRHDYPSPNRNPASYGAPIPTTHVAGDCGGVMVDGIKVYYLWGTVLDSLPGGGGSSSVRIGARSPMTGRFIQNHCVFDDQLALTIPRAVAYSAGIINHFFRGRLDIGLPADGAYAVVDHTVQSPEPAFKKLRVKVRNVTPPLGGAGQSMAGKLVAIVKYRRNYCYTSTLSGEWGVLRETLGDAVFSSAQGGCRSPEQISVSTAKNVTLAPYVQTEPATEYSFEFDFAADPVPIDATDVHLQVAFRGLLGTEDDAVVVETKDIGEPAFTAFSNGTNYLFCHNNHHYFWEENGDFPSELASVYPGGATTFPPGPLEDVAIGFGGNDADARPLVRVASIPLRSLIRFAWLGDLDRQMSVKSTFRGNTETRSYAFAPAAQKAATNQVDRSYLGNGTISEQRYATKVLNVMRHRSAFGRFFQLVADETCAAVLPSEERYALPTLIPVELVNTPLQ